MNLKKGKILTTGGSPWFPVSEVSADIAFALSILASLALWWVSLPLMDPDKLDDFGLVAILPWQYWAALAVLPMGFALSLIPSMRWRVMHLAALIALVVILHGTPAIVYGTLRYSWAWKHIGVVDYIQRHGEVDRTITFLSAYHNWPGFFWISAKLADFFHLDPLQIAGVVRFFPVFSNLVFLIFLSRIYRRFTDDSRLVFASLWIFICANWVGQDYYSPQAFTYALHLLVLALCLGPLMPASVPGDGRLSQKIWRARQILTQFVEPRQSLAAWQKILALIAMFMTIIVIVASHQLTPLVLVFSLFGLSAITALSVGYPTFAVVTLVFWIIYPAAPFTAANLPGEVAQLGQTIGGVTDRFVDTSSVDTGIAVVVWAGRALSAGAVLIGAFGWLRRLRLGARDGIVCVLLVAPMLILGLTSYGGEAVFRIYFFCLPFVAFFCASFFFPTKDTRVRLLARCGFGVLIMLFGIGFLLGNNGKDRQYRFSAEEVDAAQWLYSRSRPESLLIEVSRNYPSQFMNYENFSYVSIADEPPTERLNILENPATVLNRWFSDPNWQDGYVILTRSQRAFVETLGLLPKGAQDKLALDLMASPNFLLVYANRDAKIFRARRSLNGHAGGDGAVQ